MVIFVTALKSFVLEISLSSGVLKFFDMSPFLERGDFVLLKDVKEFKNFTIDEGGICWSCGVSLSWNTILK